MQNKFNLGLYIIASNKYYNPTPFKIKVTELTKCTILFDNLDSGTKNIRMFIDKMNKEYNLIENITEKYLKDFEKLIND